MSLLRTLKVGVGALVGFAAGVVIWGALIGGVAGFLTTWGLPAPNVAQSAATSPIGGVLLAGFVALKLSGQ